MKPNSVLSAATLPLQAEPVPAEQVIGGAPATATTALTEFGGLEVGVWEMTPGAMSDTEADELFVVLCGSARVDFVDGSPSLHLRAGDIVCLAAGSQTTWTVTQTLRKVYLTEL